MIPAPIRWPKDTEVDLIAYYGYPGSGVESQLIDVIPPFKMYADGKLVQRIKFHKKAAPALKAALDEIWEKFGYDQAKIDAARVSSFDGTYNPRKIAGSNRWSNHAFGAAIDFDAEHNGFNTGHGTMSPIVIEAFKNQGARWGGDYHGRTDPMHFEFVDTGIPFQPGEVAKPVEPAKPVTPALKLGSTGAAVKLVQTKLFVDGIFGKQTEQAVKDFQNDNGFLVADGIVGPDTWAAMFPHEKDEETKPAPATPSKKQMNITATVFGGSSDPNDSAYTGKPLNDTDFYVSVPFAIKYPRKARVFHGGLVGVASVEDKGPWCTTDDYPAQNTRPLAETCYQQKRPLPAGSGPNAGKVPSNDAGIDLSPAFAKFLGIEGKGKVDWEWADQIEEAKNIPVPTQEVRLPPTPPPTDWRDFDIWGWLVKLFKSWRA